MALEVDANGFGDCEGTHVSVFIHWKKGTYDAAFKWPFTGKVTIALLNQLEDKSHHVCDLNIDAENKILHERNLAFIPHSALTRSQFLKTQFLMNNTLYFRVSVEISDFRPWLN